MPGFGRTLKTLRTAAGVKQGDLAERLGVTQAYLSLLESEKKAPSLEFVEKVSGEFGIPASALLAFQTSLAEVPESLRDVVARMLDLQTLLVGQLVMELTQGRKTDAHSNTD